MSFNVGSVVAHVKADISDFQNGMKQVEKSAESFKGKLNSLGDGLVNVGKQVSVVSAIVGTGLTLFLKDASKEANNLERAMTTLDIISGRFGVNSEKAKQAAQDLGRELRIGIGPAAASLQNLLKAGLGLDEATDMLKRFTNEAITGKSSSITLSQAVENLSFSYATNNSAIGNLSGINENYINIIEKGRAALVAEGVSVDTITDDMAKYRGMIDLTNLTMGSSERFTGTLIDKQAILDQSILELKVSFGELINPVLAKLVDMLTKVVTWFTSLSESQKKTIIIIGLIVAAIGPFLIILGMLVNGIAAVITIGTALGTLLTFLSANPIVLIIAAIVALIAIGVLLYKNWDKVKEVGRIVMEFLARKWEELKETLARVGNQILDAIMWPFNEAKKRIEGVVNWIKDKLDFTKRQSPSVVDIVKTGVGKVNDALGDLAFGATFNANAAGAAVNYGGNQKSTTIVQVSMAGAGISDAFGAGQMGELLGDAIIKRLQQQVRI